MKMKTEETIKLIKYVTGSVAAVLLAAAMQLQFAYAAGIITLLTIQDTKKETVRITVKRMIIFVIMTILSAVIFPLAGYHVWAFGIVLIPYLFSCMALDMKEAIAPIAVLCTHYVSAKSCSPSMILNEFLILMIGAGIGTLWNLYMPDGRRQLLEYQKTVDDKIVYILYRMAIYIDLEWQKSFVSKAIQHRRDIVPIFIDGRNSNFFYNLANFRKKIGLKANIEMLYLPDETFKQRNRTFTLYIGQPIEWESLDKSKKPIEWAQEIKRKVYLLKEGR